MGVLPQKLARIMCNLTGLQSGIIWDPFCGSGTILMEAAVLGFDVLGSDIDVNALNLANENMIWLSKEGIIKGIKYNLFQLDIYNVEKKVITDLRNTGINAVVFEPFMGPPQRKILSVSKADLLIENATKLYFSLFHVLNEISQKGFRVVIVLPSYKTNKGWIDMNISQFINKKWEVLNKKYSSQDLKWKRINSIIARNIFILEKK
jgi:tRNA G10  N-methylase Trm11